MENIERAVPLNTPTQCATMLYKVFLSSVMGAMLAATRASAAVTIELVR